MAITGIVEVKSIIILVLALFSCVANGALLRSHGLGLNDRRGLIEASGAAVTIFDVTKFGAKADDSTDNALPFIQAWKAACESSAPAKVVIPAGTFLTGPAVFQGPCKSTGPIIFEVQGYLKATSDLSEYTSQEWISFEIINDLILNGKGTFDGQGSTVWQYNDCDKNKGCQPLPDSLKFFKVNNSEISEISSVNSKFFHFHVVNCHNISFHNINITAPGDSPNTDGIHISSSDLISVTNSVIGTGDDCVSVGQGTVNLTVSQVTCGPGHGLSVGSLGKYPNEKDVSGIVVTNCTLSNTTNGVRIKTYPGSKPSNALGITFQDIIMDNVKNPIIIDQNYGSKSTVPSQVKVSDVHFKNIKGTSISAVAVNLICSSAIPCEGVEVGDIDLKYTGSKALLDGRISASCSNAKVTTDGTQSPAITCV